MGDVRCVWAGVWMCDVIFFWSIIFFVLFCFFFFLLMIRVPPRSTQSSSSAASDVYKRQVGCRGPAGGRRRRDRPRRSQGVLRARR